MKKKFRLAVAIFLSVLLLLMGSACGGETKLDAPSSLNINEDYLLTWEPVEGARSYTVRVVRQGTDEVVREDTIRSASYDLSELDEGDYEIGVMATGGSRGTVLTSEWSSALSFARPYESGLVFELVGAEYRVLRAGKARGDVVIDDYYRGKPVTSIAERAFRASAEITSVEIGANIRSIGASAFYNCRQLRKVEFKLTEGEGAEGEAHSQLTSIGEAAFQGCSALTSIELPDTLTTIAPRTFAYCRNLAEVHIGASVQSVQESAFYGCSALTAVDLPDSVISIGVNAFSTDEALERVTFGKGLRTIGQEAFMSDTALSTVTFPEEMDGEYTIGVSAFQGCGKLSSLTLPEKLTVIGDTAFANSGLKRDTTSLPESLHEIGVNAFNGSAAYKDQLEDGFVYVDDWLVAISPDKRETLVNVTADMLRGTVGIAGAVFMNCTLLESVNLPSSVKYTGYLTFYNCPVLYQFTSEPNGLEYIGYMSLSNCGALSQLQLREGLLEIDNYAFYNCVNITNGNSLVPSTVTRIGQSAFGGTGLLADESGLIYASRWVVGYDEATLARDVTLADNAYGIADYALYDASKITNIIGMNRLECIGEGAFARCTSLSALSLNPDMTVIKPFAFYKCYSLYAVEFPYALEEIGDYAFYVCYRINALDFSGTNLRRVGSHAFFECEAIGSIAFGEQIEEIGDYAFFRNLCLTELTVKGNATIGAHAFSQCQYLHSLELEGVTEIGDQAFRECKELWNVTLPSSVERVGDYAFYGCRKLTHIDLGGTKTIGSHAFSGCTQLTSVELPGSVEEVGDYAFIGCRNLQSVTLHGTIAQMGSGVFFGTGTLNVSGGITFYMAGETAEGWSANWNSLLRPVVGQCVLSEDGYLESVTVGEESIQNRMSWGGLAAPVRRGYLFVGWATAPNATAAEYELNYLLQAPAGVTLYPVWETAPEETEPEHAAPPSNPRPTLPEDSWMIPGGSGNLGDFGFGWA